MFINIHLIIYPLRCTATGQAYMIMGGSAMAYATFPLADDPSNPALAATSTSVNAYTLVGSPVPTTTTDVCCSANINGCNVVSSTPTSPQPVPSTALGWDQYGEQTLRLVNHNLLVLSEFQ